MNAPLRDVRLGRRAVLKLGGLAAMSAAVGGGAIRRWTGPILNSADPTRILGAGSTSDATSPTPTRYVHLAATDGWIQLPGDVFNTESGTQLSPDPLAPAGLTTYVFGFRDVTSLDPAGKTPAKTTNSKILAQKNKAQNSAPLLYFDEGQAIQLTLTNLGLKLRPDLTDSHTVHWHGFRNATPLFDGVPEMSIAVPIAADFPYYYHPIDPGTYMYHCHFEDVEHVQMGMTGIVFVRPAQNKTGAAGGPHARYNGGSSTAPLGYAYNDGVAPGSPLSTAYDREFGIFLNEMWAQAHYNDAHIQESDWSDYEPDFYLMNGRSYPDTLAPNGLGTSSSTGNLIAPPSHPELQYQPISSLINCNAGDRVLLRFVNLGYTQASMRLAGIPMRVVGKDATILRGLNGSGQRLGADTSYVTDTIYLGAGESYDAIFTAPPFSGAGTYDTYILFNNAMGSMTRPGGSGLGGQMTEIRVHAAGALALQTAPQA